MKLEMQVFEMLPPEVYVFCLTLVSIVCIERKLKRMSRPPLKSGWIPWIGCAYEFGKEPLKFIGEAKKNFKSSVFTIKAAGKRMTFITDPKDFHNFFDTSKADFPLATSESVKNLANLNPKSFLLFQPSAHQLLKDLMFSNVNLSQLFSNLQTRLQEEFDLLPPEGEIELFRMIKEILFPSVVEVMYGKGVVPTERKDMQELLDTFLRYDDHFEYGSQIPELFLRKWGKSKKQLYDIMTKISNQQRNEDKENTRENQPLIRLVMDRIGEVHKDCGPGAGLLLFWASQANVVPSTYWTLAYILSNDHVMETLQEEMRNKLGGACFTRRLELTKADLDSVELARMCTMESIRLRSPGVIARKVIKPFKVENYTIPVGDMLMISPYWAHRNEEKFPDAESFKPERWRNGESRKSDLVLDGFLAFGAGKYSCPGRYFAGMAINLMVLMILCRLDIKLIDRVPSPSFSKLLGTQQPTGPCRIYYKKRF